MTRRRSRSVRTSFVTVLLTVGASVAGCGNDFDALFADQQTPGPVEAGATSDGGAPPTGDASTRPDAAPACGAPTACSPAVGCLGKACSNTCNGCDCTCPPFVCNADSDTCITTCAAGTTCSVTCNAEKDCALAAHGAVAKLTCEGEMDRCSMTCDEGASCELTCDLDKGGNRCIAICDATSSCLVDCGDSGPCDVNCQGGQKKTCPNTGIVTCNRDCPT